MLAPFLLTIKIANLIFKMLAVIPVLSNRILTVLRIGDVYPGSELFPPRSRVKKAPDLGSGSSTKNLSIFNPQKLLLSSWKYDTGCLIRIPDTEFFLQKAPDPESTTLDSVKLHFQR
jgi:hypothetical protein